MSCSSSLDRSAHPHEPLPSAEPAPDTADVIVVGAGPTGLTAALLLARAGVDVRVVDRNAGAAAEARALVVQARTVELWHKIGLARTAIDRGTSVKGARALLGGRNLGDGVVDLARYGAGRTPYPEVLIFGQDQTRPNTCCSTPSPAAACRSTAEPRSWTSPHTRTTSNSRSSTRRASSRPDERGT